MKKILFLLSVLTLFKCQNKVNDVGVTSKDINEVVEAIIQQDSLDVLIGNESNIMFCRELRKTGIEVQLEGDDGMKPPPRLGNIFITSLLNEEVNGEVLFSARDSLYLLSQNSIPDIIEIDKSVSEKLNYTTFGVESKKRDNGEKYNFYNLSIPIFSLDREKAYLELRHRCGALCGSGKSFYLKKVNGKWRIVRKWRTLIS